MPVEPLEHDDPREIGRYRLTARLGEGGQGIVYMGEAPDGRRVAVKMLKTTSPEARARFVREMAAARQVAAFATAAVLESLVEGRHPYVVSEYVDGPSLQERVAMNGTLRGGELDRLMVNTASALTAIHGAGIVHRDLKPANVLLGPDGPRVVDFGIARAVDAETHTEMVGTPSYFAPEWLEGAQPTRASDVFAWAGTMVFAATGHPPFGPTDSVPAILHRISTAPPDLAGVPGPLLGLLGECLDKDPARRPTARALLVRLADPSAQAGEATLPRAPRPGPQPPAPPVPPPPVPQPMAQPGGYAPTMPTQGTHPAPPPRRRTGLVIGLVAAVIALLAAAGGGGYLLANRDSGKEGRTAGNDSTGRPERSDQSTGQPTQGTSGQSGSGSGSTAIPEGFSGTWTGKVTQPAAFASQPTSDVVITLKQGESSGAISYTTWGCKTSLNVTSAGGDTLAGQESITGGPPGCTPDAVTLTKNGDQIRFRGQGIGQVEGTLRRSG